MTIQKDIFIKLSPTYSSNFAPNEVFNGFCWRDCAVFVAHKLISIALIPNSSSKFKRNCCKTPAIFCDTTYLVVVLS